MVAFAIPAYGVLFKCRARGEQRDLELGALLALLRFIDTSLKGEKITKVRVLASDPQLVFGLAHDRKNLTTKIGRQKKLERYFRRIDVIGAYVSRAVNRALCSPADLPSLPEGQKSPIPTPSPGHSGLAFGVFRKDIDL